MARSLDLPTVVWSNLVKWLWLKGSCSSLRPETSFVAPFGAKPLGSFSDP